MNAKVFLLWLGLSAPATDAEPAREPTTSVAAVEEVGRASVEVDTSHVGSEGPIIHRRVLERADVKLREHGILPAQSPDDPHIVVTVYEIEGEDPGYRAEVATDGYRDAFECPLCTETELVARIEEHLGVLAQKLPRLQSEPEPEPQPVAPNPDADATADEQPKRLGVKGKTGIALLAVGVVGVGTGIGLALREDTPKEEMPLDATSTKLPGYVTLGVGAAVTVVGAVLLGLDRRAAKRQVAWRPWWNGHGAGVGAVGRF